MEKRNKMDDYTKTECDECHEIKDCCTSLKLEASDREQHITICDDCYIKMCEKYIGIKNDN